MVVDRHEPCPCCGALALRIDAGSIECVSCRRREVEL
jgi:hypothetical protein